MIRDINVLLTDVQALLRDVADDVLPNVPAELVTALQAIESPGLLADTVAGLVDIPLERKQEILETVDVGKRLDKVLDAVAGRIEVLRLSREIGEQTRGRLDQRQREMLLREQLRTIRHELGEGGENQEDISRLAEAIDGAHMPAYIETQARKELARLERMPEASSEYSMCTSYLEWLTELPWGLPQEKSVDMAEARRILDDEHFGLEKVKRRILEYLAVRKLNPQGKGPILGFLGPPGVGKTSLGQSIAHAMGRPFVRVSLGGLHDESEIRGHRRTYVGAMPGNIIQAIRKAGTRDCVMMLDELDKLGRGVHGDPAASHAGGARSGAERYLPRTTTWARRSTCRPSSLSAQPTRPRAFRARCATAWKCWNFRGIRMPRNCRLRRAFSFPGSSQLVA